MIQYLTERRDATVAVAVIPIGAICAFMSLDVFMQLHQPNVGIAEYSIFEVFFIIGSFANIGFGIIIASMGVLYVATELKKLRRQTA